ncbi:protein Red-like [Sycon ciliatum]|uniref:protein Red-like n=1 Tax=Sycon ciliatum TaxID=27933 RepID=UPI0031F69435
MSESSSMPMVPSMMSDGEEEEKEEEEMGYSANQGTMTNADFRRMVMKSKQSASSEKTESGSVSQSVDDLQTREDAAMRRRKRKSMYAKLKRVEEERDAELAKKYRDRVSYLSTLLLSVSNHVCAPICHRFLGRANNVTDCFDVL